MTTVQAIFGVVLFLVLTWLISENRKRVPWRIVLGGISLQIILALLFLKVPVFQTIFLYLHKVVLALEKATRAGTSFVFGYAGGAPLPFPESFPGASFILAFQALPLVLVISAISALLFYWKILPQIVKGFSWVLQKTLGISGATGLGTAANVFVGMVEAPLLIKPYLKELTRSELFIVMTSGMATIAGTMMVIYASVLKDAIPDAMGHILTASIINAPGAIVIASLMVPETQDILQRSIELHSEASGPIDAITRGTMDGLQLLLGIIAMILVLVALVNLTNQILGLLPHIAGHPITLERIMGLFLAPFTWIMGIPWAEAQTAGALMGTKTVLNEFLSYMQMAKLPADALSEKSRIIMTYAMCGFANFGSLGIMIGGLGAMVPERRQEIISLGLKSILAGVITTSLTGTLIGILY